MSVKNKATGTPLGMYHIYSPYWLIAFSNELIGGTIYLHRRGASSVVRFDRQGNAKASDREASNSAGLHAFFMSYCIGLTAE